MTYYDMWLAGQALVGMCARFGLAGTIRGMGEQALVPARLDTWRDGLPQGYILLGISYFRETAD